MAAKKTTARTTKKTTATTKAPKPYASLSSLLAAKAKGTLPSAAKAHVLDDKVVVWVKGADLLTLSKADFVTAALKGLGLKVAKSLAA
jgi:hypothetical protein